MKKLLGINLRKRMPAGFTLMELMIVVAIVGVLAAIGIPSYIGYIRRSYLNEVNGAFAAIKNAEESYFSNNGCYVNAFAWPASVPSNGMPAAWGTPTGAWAQSALNVRPDRLVRFQYQIYASNTVGCAATSVIAKPSSVGCVSDPLTLIPDSLFPTNWYIVLAKGDLNGDGVTSNIISAIDDSAIIMCNELE